jgi:hypothetical protein
LRCEYYEILMNKDKDYLHIEEGFAMISKKNGIDFKNGIANNKGIIVPCIYDGIGSISSKYPILLKNNGKYGFIDHTGKEITPLKYENAREFNKDKENLAFVVENGKAFYIDVNGKFVENATEEEANKQAKNKAKTDEILEEARKDTEEFYENARKKSEENKGNTSTTTNPSSKPNTTKKTPEKCTYKCKQCNKVTQGNCNSSYTGITNENCPVRQPDPKGTPKYHEWRKQ